MKELEKLSLTIVLVKFFSYQIHALFTYFVAQGGEFFSFAGRIVNVLGPSGHTSIETTSFR